MKIMKIKINKKQKYNCQTGLKEERLRQQIFQ